MNDHLRFDDRVAIVTGGGRGLGRAYAGFLAARGARVVVNDLGAAVEGEGSDVAIAEVAAGELASSGAEVLADTSDVADPEAAARLIANTIACFGRLDIIINNAGIIRWREFPDTDVDDLTAHFSVHVVGAFNVTKAAWPHMRKQKYGRILLTTSTGMYGMPLTMAYGIAKAATVGLANSLAVAGKPHGIIVNAISPGAATRMLPPERSGLTPAQTDALRPERVAPLAGLLVHESHAESGQIFYSAAGRVSRVFLAETPGYTNSAATIEDLAEHWERVNDLDGFVIPSSTLDPRLL